MKSLTVCKYYDNYSTLNPGCCYQNSGLEQYSVIKFGNVYM